ARAERSCRTPCLVIDRRKVGVVKHSNAAANARLPVAEDVPSKAQSRSEVLDCAVVPPLRNPRVAGKQQTLRRVGEYLRRDALLVRDGIELHHPPIERVPREERLEAKPCVQRQSAAHVIVILNIESVEVVAVHKELAAALSQLVQLADQERGWSILRVRGIETEISGNVCAVADVVELPLHRASNREGVAPA